VLRPGMVAYSIFCDRPFSLGFLTMLHDDGTFLVTPIEPKEHFHLHEEEIVYTHEFARVTDVVLPHGPCDGSATDGHADDLDHGAGDPVGS
jgi:hypothetical protein